MNEEETPLSFSAPKIARGLVLENKGLREFYKGYYEEVWRDPQFGHDTLVIKSLFFLFLRGIRKMYYEEISCMVQRPKYLGASVRFRDSSFFAYFAASFIEGSC